VKVISMKNRKSLLYVGLLVLLLGGLVLPSALLAEEKPAELSAYGNPFTRVTIGQVKVQAEVVNSMEKMYLGLGKRPELPEGRGMLFIMPSPAVQNFCMRDMRFALDFLWIDSGRVRGMTKNVPYEDQQACYYSPEPVKFVLEVPAGFCDRHGLRVGDKVTWK
jgi:uncharacterized membrane protein (UPF0127 family)